MNECGIVISDHKNYFLHFFAFFLIRIFTLATHIESFFKKLVQKSTQRKKLVMHRLYKKEASTKHRRV